MPAADRNPFRYGGLARDEAFTDRERELAELRSDARNGQDVVIVAPRRMGKSSLVDRVAERSRRDGLLVGQIDLMTCVTKERLAEKLAQVVLDGFAGGARRAKEGALGLLRGLRVTPEVSVDPSSGAWRFTFAAGRAPADLDATLERLLELPAELAAERGKPALLVFDEFQEVVDLDPALPRLLRAVFQQQSGVAHLYLGSKRHMMERIFNDASEPFWRSAKHLELGPIAPGRFAPFIAERFEASGRRAAPEVVERVLAITGGHPYATQELCYFLWEETGRRRTAREAELALALDATLRSEHAHFSLLWDGLAAGQRVVLSALAHDPGRPMTQGYRRAHPELPQPGTVQKAIEALERQELIAREGGHAVVSEPFLADWVRQLDA